MRQTPANQRPWISRISERSQRRRQRLLFPRSQQPHVDLDSPARSVLGQLGTVKSTQVEAAYDGTGNNSKRSSSER